MYINTANILFDISMEEMGGLETARKIRKQSKDIYMTGYVHIMTTTMLTWR